MKPNAVLAPGDDAGYWWFRCPGCDRVHVVTFAPAETPQWDWNHDTVKPTITPSLLCQWGKEKRCHSFVRDGQIEFLSDCTHALAGQTVPLPIWKESP